MAKGDVFSPHRLQRLLVFLLTRNKDRPAQLVFFLHPPLSADCIAGTGLCGSAAPPNRRLTHYPACPVEGRATVGDERARSRRGGWEESEYCGGESEEIWRNCAFIPKWKRSDTPTCSRIRTHPAPAVLAERGGDERADLGGLFNYAGLCLCLKDTNY